MMQSRSTIVLLLAVIFACTCFGGAAASRPSAGVDRWEQRLARLDPVRPIDYLELGEEVADSAATRAERRLARELFGLAGALDSARLGRSAMLALASIAESDAEYLRAVAAAELVGGRGAKRWTLVAEPAQLEALARAISYHRRAEGRKALAALKQDNADDLLSSVGGALAGDADVFRDECKSMKPGSQPVADEDMVVRGILVELALRSGDLRTPGLDMALFGDVALPEIDLSDPQSTWNVDPKRAWWRGGKWSGNG